jgi:hypothetical protein
MWSVERPTRSVGRAFRGLAFVLLTLSAGARDAGAREREISAEERATARALLAEASAAFEAGKYEVALVLFDRAAEVVEAPTISLMQARTLVQLGRLVSAAEHYERAQQIDTPDAGNAAFRQAAEEARAERELLLARIPTLRIKLTGADSHGAEVSIDGRPLAPDEATAEQLLDPGTHSVKVKSAAGTSSARTIVLVERAREEIVFKLEPAVNVPAGVAPEQRLPKAAHEPPKKVRVAGWVVLGSGVAFTGAGAVFGGLALSHKSDLDGVCTAGCPPEYEDDIHAYRVERTLSYVGFGLGAAGIGVGLYLLLRDEPDETATAFVLTPRGVAVSRRFH